METKQSENTEIYQKHYSDEDFWNKVKSVAKKAGGKVIYVALLLYYVLKSPSVSSQDKLLIIGALGYFILPADLIPDFITVAGFTDDFAALYACYKTVKNNITPEIEQQATKTFRDWFGDESVPLLD
jgi:uncharacterized membrane protein YkvA (DUF1232 family)